MATTAEPIDQIKERIDLIANAKARDEIEAGAKLIDVREPHEWDEAHLEGAVHVPQGELLDRISEVAPDHSERIVLYCRTDNRSSRAADALQDLGYENVSVMRGGIVDWQENGLPVVAAQGMTSEQRMRYSRHTLLPEVGVDGQIKLLNSKVLLIGAGGPGPPARFFSGRAGGGQVGNRRRRRRRRVQPSAP